MRSTDNKRIARHSGGEAQRYGSPFPRDPTRAEAPSMDQPTSPTDKACPAPKNLGRRGPLTEDQLTEDQKRDWALGELFYARRKALPGVPDHPSSITDEEEEAQRQWWLDQWQRGVGLAGRLRAEGPGVRL